MMTTNNEFLFPSDRFPVFGSKPEHQSRPLEFGPPLTFDIESVECQKLQDYHEVGFEFVPEGAEKEKNIMEILFNIQDDEYYRPHNNSLVKGWRSCVYRVFNIEKKREGDWNMGYLARKDISVSDRGNILNAVIEWRFNLVEHGLKVKNLQVRLPYKTYRDGKVKVSVCSKDDYTVLLDSHNLKPVVRARGWQDFVIRAELSGEEGDVTYQNAQLLRQPLMKQCLNDEWKYPFKVLLETQKA